MHSIDIVFATLNGEKTLKPMLDSFTKIKFDNYLKFRIIAVDNNSNDGTIRLLKQYRELLNITIIEHKTPGKNAALNSALNHLSAELVVFTDDDIIPDHDWLHELCTAAENNPDFSIFGGLIKPFWESPLPEWIRLYVPMGPAFGCTSLKDSQEEVSPFSIWGANMMIRSKLVISDGFRFNESVGPRPGSYIMGSETDLTRRLHEAGNRCLFVPTAKVSHIIRTSQLNQKWISSRAKKFGRSIARDEKMEMDIDKKNVVRIFGIPRWRIAEWLITEVKNVKNNLTLNDFNKNKLLWKTNLLRGYIAQAWSNNK